MIVKASLAIWNDQSMDLEEAWLSGKDFKMDIACGGQYFSIRDVPYMKADGIKRIYLAHRSKLIKIDLEEV